MSRRRRATALATGLLAAAGVAAFVAATRDGDGPAPALVDGSRAAAAPLGGDGVRAAVLATRAGALPTGLLAACVRPLGLGAVPPATPAVLRVGVRGRTLTFRDPAAPRLYACDGSVRREEGTGPWCGTAVGRLRGRRLVDPRLDIANCRDADGDPVAFAWVSPRSSRVAWVVVGRGASSEWHRVAGGLPVRVAVEARAGSDSVRLVIRQLDAAGAELAAGEERVDVSG